MTKDEADKLNIEKNDVFQITDIHGRDGWIGCFVQASEIKSWGIQGYVCIIETHDKQSKAYIRLNWNEIEYIGKAVMVPKDDG
jgi:hypothetical protein